MSRDKGTLFDGLNKMNSATHLLGFAFLVLSPCATALSRTFQKRGLDPEAGNTDGISRKHGVNKSPSFRPYPIRDRGNMFVGKNNFAQGNRNNVRVNKKWKPAQNIARFRPNTQTVSRPNARKGDGNGNRRTARGHGYIKSFRKRPFQKIRLSDQPLRNTGKRGQVKLRKNNRNLNNRTPNRKQANNAFSGRRLHSQRKDGSRRIPFKHTIAHQVHSQKPKKNQNHRSGAYSTAQYETWRRHPDAEYSTPETPRVRGFMPPEHYRPLWSSDSDFDRYLWQSSQALQHVVLDIFD